MYRFYAKSDSKRGPEPTPAMAALTESSKVRNLESSILFLQQQHAETLKALHDEIRVLQKKNSELTFRLEIGPGVPTSADNQLEEKVRTLTLQVQTNRHQLDTTTQEKDQRIHQLEKQMKQQEKTFREELKTYSAKMRKYQQELTNKADTIADLQLKLHSFNSDIAGRRSSDTPRLVPTPPKDGAPKTRRGSRKTIVPIEVKSLPADRPLSGSLRRDYVLDPTPFLIREGSPLDSVPQKRDPLPPIAGQERTQSPIVRRTETEVVELALGSVQKNSDNWRPAPSHSTNFK